jgi:hypothetical protein
VAAYIGGIARQNGMIAMTVGGIEDHVHLLLALPTMMPVAKSVQLIKAGSSKWFRETHSRMRENALVCVLQAPTARRRFGRAPSLRSGCVGHEMIPAVPDGTGSFIGPAYPALRAGLKPFALRAGLRRAVGGDVPP